MSLTAIKIPTSAGGHMQLQDVCAGVASRLHTGELDPVVGGGQGLSRALREGEMPVAEGEGR